MRRLLFCALVVAAALAMGMGGTVVAQNSNETAADGSEIEFGDDLRILEYDLEDGKARITFEADQPKTVVVSDGLAGVDQDGAVQVPEQEYDLTRGRTPIAMDVREYQGGSMVSVSVDGLAVRLSSEFDDEPKDPLQYFGGLSGLFTGIGMSVGLAGTAAVYVLRREDSGVIQA